MRRATGIGLVLLGGDVAFGLSQWDSRSAECREAQAQSLPNAEEVCRNSRGGSGGHSSSSSSHGSSSTITTSVSQRGGFGSSASHFSGGG